MEVLFAGTREIVIVSTRYQAKSYIIRLSVVPGNGKRRDAYKLLSREQEKAELLVFCG